MRDGGDFIVLQRLVKVLKLVDSLFKEYFTFASDNYCYSEEEY